MHLVDRPRSLVKVTPYSRMGEILVELLTPLRFKPLRDLSRLAQLSLRRRPVIAGGSLEIEVVYIAWVWSAEELEKNTEMQQEGLKDGELVIVKLGGVDVEGAPRAMVQHADLVVDDVLGAGLRVTAHS